MLENVMRVLLLASLLIAFPALAAPKPEVLGQFGKWTSYRHQEGQNQPVCYAAAPPIKSRGHYSKRDDAFLMITHRPRKKTRNVVSYVAGYAYNPKVAVIARVDKQDYLMVPNGDMAWTPNQRSDDTLTKALRKGGQLAVIGVSKKGTRTMDTYSLKGISKALDTIDRACPPK